ncbi:hypothetical protein DL93DRAFT_2086952 [Clavulina sp. PMI_390]|nr:hypothetical protein DL93DRAFT_2086952 [Clavulina sp. PMI_390]
MSSPANEGHGDSSRSNGGAAAPLERISSRASLTNLAGQDWSFKAVDERYLLPLFSNSVASRSSNARRASRRAAMGANADGATQSREESDLEYDEGGDEDHGAFRGDFTTSVSNFFGRAGTSNPGNPSDSGQKPGNT